MFQQMGWLYFRGALKAGFTALVKYLGLAPAYRLFLHHLPFECIITQRCIEVQDNSVSVEFTEIVGTRDIVSSY